MSDRIGNDDIASLIHKASIAFHALPESEQAKLMEEQRNSWVLGEAAIARQERLQKVVDNHPLQTHANTQESVEYTLTKLQGTLVRLTALPNLFKQEVESAVYWADTLRKEIEKQRGYWISHG